MRTDGDGRFRFTHIKPRAANLTVQARWYGPDMKAVNLHPDLPPVEFRLGKGRTIRGRVVDRHGEPLAGVNVFVNAWRKEHTLSGRTETDDEGAFRWEDAPLDVVSMNVALEGYLSVRGLEIAPTDDAIAITLIKPLKVRGTVVDAETRHAIPSFLLVPGMESGKGASTYWERNRSRTMARGRYEIRFDDALRKEGRRIRIEADGYMPGVSRVIHDDEDEPVVNFVLQKDAGISGIVRLPDGAPLVGADVVLVSPSQPAFINNGRPPESVQHRVVKAGADGRFAFPSQEPPFTILALHDRGFAQQTIDTSPPSTFDLTTRPWGRVEGVLRVGNRPGAGLPVSLSYMEHGDTPRTIPWWSGEGKTDTEGRFVFERVRPGAVDVRGISWSRRRDRSRRSTTVRPLECMCPPARRPA